MSPSPLEELKAKSIRAIFTDLDGTVTFNSQILETTYEMLWKLHKENIFLAIISGRPAGWADCLMRLWPIDAMVFENGAGYLFRDAEKIRTVSLVEKSHLTELQDIFESLKSQIPHLKLSTDQPFRLCDFAIDYAEEKPFLTKPELTLVLETLSKQKNITFKLSSIHVNYWHGEHTKVTAVRRLMETVLAPKAIKKENIVFCGDSPNDEPLFEFFEHSVGVANIHHFLPQMKHTPKYLTQRFEGEGFEEVGSLWVSERDQNSF